MPLNAAQLRAVQSTGHLLIPACPGSGKTTTLVARAGDLLDRYRNARIALVCFNRSAAAEIRARFAKSHQRHASRMQAETFHSFALRQAEAAGLKVNLADEVMTRAMISRLWQEVSYLGGAGSNLSFEAVLKELDTYRLTGVPATHEDPEQCSIVALSRRYKAELSASGRTDFTGLLKLIVDGMRSGRIEPLDVTHLLVDEFQDVDAMQLDWVFEHVRVGICVTAVGDDDQSLYGWRAAKGYDAFLSFEALTGAETVVLEESYRCAQSIAQAANSLIERNAGKRVAKRIVTRNPGVGRVRSVTFANRQVEAAGALYELRSAIKAAAHTSTAIITRTNGYANIVELIATALDIKVNRIGGSSMWKVPGAWHMVWLLGSYYGVRDTRALHALLLGARFPLDQVRAGMALAGRARNPLQELVNNRAWLGKGQLDAPATACLNHLERLANADARDVAGVVKLARDAVLQNAPDRDYDRMATAAGRILEREGANRSLGDVVGGAIAYRPSQQAESGRAGTIDLLTIHGSKGLEWDRVWVLGWSTEYLPHKSGDEVEERRLAYVGVTRGREEVVASRALNKGDRSPFLNEMGCGIDEAGYVPTEWLIALSAERRERDGSSRVSTLPGIADIPAGPRSS